MYTVHGENPVPVMKALPLFTRLQAPQVLQGLFYWLTLIECTFWNGPTGVVAHTLTWFSTFRHFWSNLTLFGPNWTCNLDPRGKKRYAKPIILIFRSTQPTLDRWAHQKFIFSCFCIDLEEPQHEVDDFGWIFMYLWISVIFHQVSVFVGFYSNETVDDQIDSSDQIKFLTNWVTLQGTDISQQTAKGSSSTQKCQTLGDMCTLPRRVLFLYSLTSCQLLNSWLHWMTEVRLVCFPHSGGGPSAFSTWPQYFEDSKSAVKNGPQGNMNLAPSFLGIRFF